MRSATSKAIAATTEARIGEHTLDEVQPETCYFVSCPPSAGPVSDPLRDGFQATSLDSDEAVRLLHACTRHQDHCNGFKVAAVVLLGTSMGFRGKWHMLLAELALQNSEVSMQQDAGWWQPTPCPKYELVLQIWHGIDCLQLPDSSLPRSTWTLHSRS